VIICHHQISNKEQNTVKIKIIMMLFAVVAFSAMGCDKSLSFKDVSPKTGNMSGGEPLEIIGSGFDASMGFQVYVGTNKVDNVQVRGDDRLVVTTPPSAVKGAVDIIVALDNGEEYRIPGVFSYVDKSAAGGGMDIRKLGSGADSKRRVD
jgi:hypothetical protein